MRYAVAAVLAGLFVALPVFCAGDDKEAKKEEKKELSRAEQLQEIKSDHRENTKKLEGKFRESTDPAEKRKLQVEFQKGTPFVERALDLVKADPKDDVAFDALMFAMGVGPLNENNSKVLDLLVANHVDKPAFARVVPMLARLEPSKGIAALEQVLAKSENKDVKGMASLSLGNLNADESDDAFEKDPAKSQELAAKAIKYFSDVKEKYGDVKISPRAPELGKQADGRLYELKNLRVGMTAPDVESELLDGKKVKLSDYRGKVVVLDIWATWCGPCRAMIPHERDMVKKLKDKPFELISVSADDEKTEVNDFLKKEEMPWTHWYSGPDAGIVKEWNVRFFPTIYVIDSKGVIRFKNIRNEQLEAAVEKLVAEVK